MAPTFGGWRHTRVDDCPLVLWSVDRSHDLPGGWGVVNDRSCRQAAMLRAAARWVAGANARTNPHRTAFHPKGAVRVWATMPMSCFPTRQGGVVGHHAVSQGDIALGAACRYHRKQPSPVGVTATYAIRRRTVHLRLAPAARDIVPQSRRPRPRVDEIRVFPGRGGISGQWNRPLHLDGGSAR